MANRLMKYALVVRDKKQTLDVLQAKEYEKERKTSAIIRLVHSIEKGLCLENPRAGFGMAKLEKLFMLCRSYADAFGADEFCLMMARDVVKAYIDFHQALGHKSDDYTKVCEAYASFPVAETASEEIYGGVVRIKNKSELTIGQLEKFFADRHSIRDFDGSEVPKEKILKAIHAAQYAPSACNRQAVRVYVLPSQMICRFYEKDLAGIGGFAQNADKFILITGKLSAYDEGEHDQHIVSASIFAAYLVEALFAQNIGSCLIQRPLYYSKQWQQIAREIHVPEDERLVLMIAIGNMKDEYMAPVSKRFPTEHIVKFVE